MPTDYTTTTNAMPAWLQPYASGYMQRAQQVADMPYQGYGGQRVADFDPAQTNAYQSIIQRAQQGSPLMGAANSTLQNTIQGGFLQGNPYLQSQIDQAQGDLARNWNTVQKPQFDTAMQRSGSFGNSGVAEMTGNAMGDLSNAMGRIGSDMRFNAYNTERGYQQQALGMAPAFAQADYNDANQMLAAGNAYQGQQQRQLDDSYQRFLESRNYPREQLGVMRDALSGVNYGSTSTTAQPGANTAAQAIGGALTAAQLYQMLFGGP